MCKWNWLKKEPDETESKIGKERHTKDVKRTSERINNKRREKKKKKRKRINGNEMESAYNTHAFAVEFVFFTRTIPCGGYFSRSLYAIFYAARVGNFFSLYFALLLTYIYLFIFVRLWAFFLLNYWAFWYRFIISFVPNSMIRLSAIGYIGQIKHEHTFRPVISMLQW